MALIREALSDRLQSLGARCLVGRSRSCAVVVSDPTVSAEHAVIFLGVDGRWCVRDLGSRNGTWVDDQRVTGGEVCELRMGSTLRLGSRAHTWTLVDDALPCPCAVDPAGTVRRALDEVLVLPDEERPDAWVLRSGADWIVEHGDGSVQPVSEAQKVIAGGRTWQLLLPRGEVGDLLVPTMGASVGPSIVDIGLEFHVSHDGAFVQFAWAWGEERHLVPPRACHRLVLLLARQRLRDRELGLPEEDCGWVHPDQLQELLDASAQKVHVDVLRCRRQLARMGVSDADDLFQRRSTTRAIRVGVTRLLVTAAERDHVTAAERDHG